MFQKKSPMVGIDISSTAVKLLELSRRGEHYQVERFAVELLPPGVVVEKNIKDSQALATAIQQMLLKSNCQAKSAIVALPDSLIIHKLMKFEKHFSPEELELQVALEADKLIPYPLSEIRLDFDVLGENAENSALNDVAVVASRAECVDSRVNCLAQSGLEVNVVDVESFTMERACRLFQDTLPQSGKNVVVAIMDIGSMVTSLTVLDNMTKIFSHEDVFGEMQLVQLAERHYGLSYEEASRLGTVSPLPEDYASAVMKPFCDSALLQIKRALQIFMSSGHQQSVDHLVLSGSISSLAELALVVAAETGLSVSLAQPFHKMSLADTVDPVDLQQSASGFLLCCGLAMRSADVWQR